MIGSLWAGVGACSGREGLAGGCGGARPQPATLSSDDGAPGGLVVDVLEGWARQQKNSSCRGALQRLSMPAPRTRGLPAFC